MQSQQWVVTTIMCTRVYTTQATEKATSCRQATVHTGVVYISTFEPFFIY